MLKSYLLFAFSCLLALGMMPPTGTPTPESPYRFAYTADKQEVYCPDSYGTAACKDCPEPCNTPPANSCSFMEMVYVQGGNFQMGCTSEQGGDCEVDEKPSHSVTLGDYYIGKYEVTQKQWLDIMGSNPSHFTFCEDCPVESVSWDDIQEFLRKLNQKYPGCGYRLPTEVEWEYAARGGGKQDGTKYAGGNSLDNVGWYYNNASDKTHPVGQKSPNGLGIYDMSGNVWEYCSDWYKGYPGSSGVSDYSGSGRVRRGGSWTYYPQYCRVSNRSYAAPDYGSHFIGFRLARLP